VPDPTDQPSIDPETIDPRSDGPPSTETLRMAKRAIEAIVLVATDPIPDQLLAQVIELPVVSVRQLCAELAQSYRHEDRGFQFVEVAGGWRYQTHPDLAPYIEKYVLEGQTARLSSAALETLSIVAYKQPLSRAQMSAIRGVNVDGVLRTLVQKGYVEEVGQDSGPGQASLFGTTQLFLERLGLASVDDLPPLGEFVPDASVVEALELTLRVAPDEPHLPLDEESGVDPDPADPAS
jgi:segregation and condensation protein B